MSDLSFHVRQFLPAAVGPELEHRTLILRLRDHAAAMQGRTTSRRAFDLACDCHELAGAWAFASGEPIESLEVAAKLAKRLMQAAILAEHLDNREVAI